MYLFLPINSNLTLINLHQIDFWLISNASKTIIIKKTYLYKYSWVILKNWKILIKSTFTNNIIKQTFFLFNYWSELTFNKLKFSGKGYKLVKKKKKIAFFLNFSHILIFFNSTLILKKLKKNILFIVGKQKYHHYLSHRLKTKRPQNKYTNKGIRNYRQSLSNRKGKN